MTDGTPIATPARQPARPPAPPTVVDPPVVDSTGPASADPASISPASIGPASTGAVQTQRAPAEASAPHPGSPSSPAPDGPTGETCVRSWIDPASLDALDLLVASVVEMSHFQVAVINIRRDDDLVTVATEGDEGLRTTLLGVGAPVDLIEQEIAGGQTRGRFVHVPAAAQSADLDHWSYYSPGQDAPVSTGPDGWDPHDAFMAPLCDDTGRLIGLLSIDIPLSNKLPSASENIVLDRYASVAERTVRGALERARLAARVRLSETARIALRLAAGGGDLTAALAECRSQLMLGYRADFVAVRSYGGPGVPEVGSPEVTSGGPAIGPVREAISRLWNERRTGLLPSFVDDPIWHDLDHDTAMAQLAALGLSHLMLVPFGVGPQVQGHLLIGRAAPDLPFTEDELGAALDTAADIGVAIANSRTLSREQQLSTYKSDLLSTVSHELKNPLGVITGHLELMDGGPDLSAESQYSVSAILRASRRIGRLVDDLLLLAQVQDRGPLQEVASASSVLVGDVLDDALELVRFASQQRNLRVEVELPERPVAVRCDHAQLEHVMTNLLTNAVKYSHRDGSVTVAVIDLGAEVEIAVSDTGLGISEKDQASLFQEFFRSTNPTALAQPGTGLGLAICARIVDRQGGRIVVESELDRGTTFRVILPAG